jgi:hypothetical protein
MTPKNKPQTSSLLIRASRISLFMMDAGWRRPKLCVSSDS